MARVTVEDCVEVVKSRFELVMLAAQRAKKLGAGAQITVERDNDKNAVVALREISEGTILPENLREEVIRSHQRITSIEDEDSEDMIDVMDGEVPTENQIAAPVSDVKSSEGPNDEPSLEDIAGGSGN